MAGVGTGMVNEQMSLTFTSDRQAPQYYTKTLEENLLLLTELSDPQWEF